MLPVSFQCLCGVIETSSSGRGALKLDVAVTPSASRQPGVSISMDLADISG